MATPHVIEQPPHSEKAHSKHEAAGLSPHAPALMEGAVVGDCVGGGARGTDVVVGPAVGNEVRAPARAHTHAQQYVRTHTSAGTCTHDSTYARPNARTRTVRKRTHLR
jgi:hypothetical protein